MAGQNSFTFGNDTAIDKPNIDLSSVEEVLLPDGHRYVKYVDDKGIPTMLEINDDKKANEVIEGIQVKTNGFDMLDDKKYSRENIILVPIDKIGEYQYAFNNMTSEQKTIISLFIKNKDRFNPKLKYINADESIAIDENNKVITAVINKTTNRIDVNYAEVIKHDVNKIEEQNEVVESIEDINFSAIIDMMEANNIPYDIAGYQVDMDSLRQYDRYPETFEQQQMSSRERVIWSKLLDAFRRRQQKNDTLENPPKVKVKATTSNNNMGYTNQLLTVSLATFAIGVIFGILIFVLKIFS